LNAYAAGIQIRRARIYDTLDMREKAADAYNRALQADPHNASYHIALGLHHQRWGDAAAAEESFRRAAKLADMGTLPAGN